ncbi:MAG: hypothetical protein H7255_10635 [Ramlibacter sp.]|nr:hypothetical protein [Ramlibacter sp.]
MKSRSISAEARPVPGNTAHTAADDDESKKPPVSEDAQLSLAIVAANRANWLEAQTAEPLPLSEHGAPPVVVHARAPGACAFRRVHRDLMDLILHFVGRTNIEPMRVANDFTSVVSSFHASHFQSQLAGWELAQAEATRLSQPVAYQPHWPTRIAPLLNDRRWNSPTRLLLKQSLQFEKMLNTGRHAEIPYADVAELFAQAETMVPPARRGYPSFDVHQATRTFRDYVPRGIHIGHANYWLGEIITGLADHAAIELQSLRDQLAGPFSPAQ